MTTIPKSEDILLPELHEFAVLLAGSGFRVFVFKSEVERVAKGGKKSIAKTLGFSRMVDDVECNASVSASYTYPFGGFQFTMPIKPSREHGSSMFIGDDRASDSDELTLANAELYASPTGYNRLVGTHKNYHQGFAHLYVEIHPETEEG